MGLLKGKTPWWSKPHIQVCLTYLPVDILEQYHEVSLTGDLMFINGLYFVITKSHNILFTTYKHITNGNSKTLLASPKEFNKVYTQRGFKITRIHVNSEF